MLDACETAFARLFPPAAARAAPWLFLAPALLLVGLLALGLVTLLDSSFRTLDPETFLLSEAYTLRNYADALSNGVFLAIVGRTFGASLLVTALTLALAFPYAYVMVRTPSSALRKILLVSLFLPFFIGQVVRAYGWLIILGTEGLANDLLGVFGLGPYRMLYNYWAVVFGLVQYMLPFAALLLAPALTAIPEDMERAAASLGASRVATILHVVLPMAAPGLYSAGAVVFTLTLTDFAMPAILGGGANDFAANATYDAFFRISDAGLGAALAILLIVLGSAAVGVATLLFGARVRGDRRRSAA
jgi:putative spermidine/putrescine transport system permease protein